jgi:hypothetical protein
MFIVIYILAIALGLAVFIMLMWQLNMITSGYDSFTLLPRCKREY